MGYSQQAERKSLVMSKRAFVLPVVCIAALAAPLWAWGQRGHHVAVSGAITALPEPLKEFYVLNRDYIVAHSIDPDEWVTLRINTPGHAHFIDLDMLDNAPFSDIPADYESAAAEYGEDLLKKAGTLPWEIARRSESLAAAFRERRWEDVVNESAWISHFIADSTMPLHTTKNYLGQLTGNIVLPEGERNRSVHHRLEWGLLDSFQLHYEGVTCPESEVKRMDDVLATFWSIVKESYELIPEVLAADRQAASLDSAFGPVFYEKFDALMRPLVDNQLRRSQGLIASVWLTAWEDAGRPELPAGFVIRERSRSRIRPDTPVRTVADWTVAGGAAVLLAVLAAATVWVRMRRRAVPDHDGLGKV
jgi:hypothetical protein